MSGLFIDTGVWIALVSPGDRHRDRALRVLADIGSGTWSQVITSDFVVAEALNYVARKIRHPPPTSQLFRKRT